MTSRLAPGVTADHLTRATAGGFGPPDPLLRAVRRLLDPIPA